MEDHLTELQRLLDTAPFETGGWASALALSSQVVGARFGQFMLWSGRDGALEAVNPEEMAEGYQHWLALGGDRPRNNPLAAHAAAAGVMRPYSDADVLPYDARARHPLWQEVYQPLDVPHLSVTQLVHTEAEHAMLVLMRGRSQGAFGPDDQVRVKLLAYMWGRTVRQARAMGDDAGRILKGALDAVGVAAFVLDAAGMVRVASAAALTLAAAGRLQLRRGRLHATSPAEDAQLAACLRSCLESGRGEALSLAPAADCVLRLTISTLPPAPGRLPSGPAVVVVCRPLVRPPGLTGAEGHVARMLLSGRTLPEIAEARRRSVETIRSHAKAIYAKAAVRGHAEFLSKYGEAAL